MNSSYVLGSRIDLLSRADLCKFISLNIHEPRAKIIVTANTEMYYQALTDKPLQSALNTADICMPDSIGILWALRQKGIREGELFPGVEICDWLLKQGYSIYLLGAKQEVLDRISLPNVVGKQQGYFSQREIPGIIEKINQIQPQILLVGLGAGKQELWMNKYQKQLKVPIIIGVGGSIDIIAGSKKRAPKLFRILYLEWLYRLIQEPSRIFRQIKLVLFCWEVLKQKWQKK